MTVQFARPGSGLPGVVGPLAPSATIRARIRLAFSAVIWFSGAGTRTREGSREFGMLTRSPAP